MQARLFGGGPGSPPLPNALSLVVPRERHTNNKARLMGVCEYPCLRSNCLLTLSVQRLIYPTQTLLEENSYGTVLQMADRSTEVKVATLYLASTYARQVLPNWEDLQTAYESRLVQGLETSMENLAASSEVLLTMSMLLIHQQVVNGERGWARTSRVLAALQNLRGYYSTKTSRRYSLHTKLF